MKKENYKIGDWVYMNDYYDKEQVIGAFSETTFNNVLNFLPLITIEHLVGIKRDDLIKYERFTHNGGVYTYDVAKFLFNNHYLDDLGSFSEMNDEQVIRYIANTIWCEENTRSSQYDKLLDMYSRHSTPSKAQECVIELLNTTANSPQRAFTEVPKWIEVNGWDNEVKAIIKGNGWRKIKITDLVSMWNYEVANNAKDYLNDDKTLCITTKIHSNNGKLTENEYIISFSLYAVQKHIYQVIMIGGVECVPNQTFSGDYTITEEDIENFLSDNIETYDGEDYVYYWYKR